MLLPLLLGWHLLALLLLPRTLGNELGPKLGPACVSLPRRSLEGFPVSRVTPSLGCGLHFPVALCEPWEVPIGSFVVNFGVMAGRVGTHSFGAGCGVELDSATLTNCC